jgi:hypothetical protein
VADYRRIRDSFLDLQYRAQATQLGEADAKARSLEGVDLALAEPGTSGLAHQLAKLWSSFANLANNPSSDPARQVLLEQARTLASSFAELDGQLATISEQASNELAALTAYDPATAGTARSRRSRPSWPRSAARSATRSRCASSPTTCWTSATRCWTACRSSARSPSPSSATAGSASCSAAPASRSSTTTAPTTR